MGTKGLLSNDEKNQVFVYRDGTPGRAGSGRDCGRAGHRGGIQPARADRIAGALLPDPLDERDGQPDRSRDHNFAGSGKGLEFRYGIAVQSHQRRAAGGDPGGTEVEVFVEVLFDRMKYTKFTNIAWGTDDPATTNDERSHLFRSEDTRASLWDVPVLAQYRGFGAGRWSKFYLTGGAALQDHHGNPFLPAHDLPGHQHRDPEVCGRTLEAEPDRRRDRRRIPDCR